jgi:hypothetical protein
MVGNRKLGIVALGLCGALGFVAAAEAGEGVCGDRKSFLDRLAKEYDESPMGIGLQADGSVMELLTAPTGSWSLIITTPTGITCVISSGNNWNSRAPLVIRGRDA